MSGEVPPGIDPNAGVSKDRGLQRRKSRAGPVHMAATARVVQNDGGLGSRGIRNNPDGTSSRTEIAKPTAGRRDNSAPAKLVP